MSEEYSVGYGEGYQIEWNEAMDSMPAQPKAEQEPIGRFTGKFWTDDVHNRMLCEVVCYTPPVAGAGLYTHPQPKQKPLTDEQRSWIVATCPTPRHIIDTVEKMHGIKGEA